MNDYHGQIRDTSRAGFLEILLVRRISLILERVTGAARQLLQIIGNGLRELGFEEFFNDRSTLVNVERVNVYFSGPWVDRIPRMAV